MKRLGIIGGLGPMATALFMKMIVEMTEAGSDQEHIESIVYNWPKIPDRTSYILGKSRENPAVEMLKAGRKLVSEGVDWIAIPCVTANYFYRELSEGLKPARVIPVIEETGKYLKERGITHTGLLATSGTVESGLFQEILGKYGCEVILPSPGGQENVMHVIYNNVKANRAVERERFFSASDEVRAAGAEVILLGCTELSAVSLQCPLGAGYLDVMRLLAKCAVEHCGRLRGEYEELITDGKEQG